MLWTAHSSLLIFSWSLLRSPLSDLWPYEPSLAWSSLSGSGYAADIEVTATSLALFQFELLYARVAYVWLMWLLPIKEQTPLFMQSEKDLHLLQKKLEKVLVKITVSAGRQGKLEVREGGMDQPQ